MAFVESKTTADYTDLLLRLSPPGAAFGPDGRWEDFLSAVAVNLARINLRVAQADLESDPRTADETIEDWESMLGIIPTSTDLTIRQQEAHARYIATGGQSVAYFTELADALGVAITITEPLALGWTVTDAVTDPLYSWTARYIWIVTGPSATVPSVRAIVESLLGELKPAQTRVYFSWTA